MLRASAQIVGHALRDSQSKASSLPEANARSHIWFSSTIHSLAAEGAPPRIL
jgi:hypothetical protein